MPTNGQRRTTNGSPSCTPGRSEVLNPPSSSSRTSSGRRSIIPQKELLERYAAGEGVPALAVRYGCAELTVRAHLRKLGAMPIAKSQRRVDISRAALEELYTQHQWPIIRIAAHFGVSPVTIDARRRALGIPARRPSRRSSTARREER